MKDSKTYSSRRIALDDATVRVLDAQRRRVAECAAACEVEFDPEGYVFTESADGADPLHPDTITGRTGQRATARSIASDLPTVPLVFAEDAVKAESPLDEHP